MKKIFIGLFFLNFDVAIQGINFMPAFLGCFLIFLGLGEEYECPSLNASRTIAVASGIILAAQWFAGLFGYGMTFPVTAILRLLNTYRLVVWAGEQAEDQEWSGTRVRRFRTSWYALAGTTAAAVLLSRLSAALALVWSLASIAATVYYIYVFYTLWVSAAPEDGRGA